MPWQVAPFPARIVAAAALGGCKRLRQEVDPLLAQEDDLHPTLGEGPFQVQRGDRFLGQEEGPDSFLRREVIL